MIKNSINFSDIAKFLQIFAATSILFFSTAFAGNQKIQMQKQKQLLEMALQDWAGSINLSKTPTDFLKKYQGRYTEEELSYLNKLVKEKTWVEMPKAKIEDQTLVLELPSKTVRIEVVDFFKSQYRVNGYDLDWSLHADLPSQLRYLQRVVNKKSAANSIWHIFLGAAEAQANITCNALIKTGCVEISAATAIWAAQEIAADSPLRHCADIYYNNKNNATTLTCLEKYKGSPNLEAMKELAEIFVQVPNAKLEIECNKKDGPELIINGVNVPRIGTSKNADSYSIPIEINPDLKFNKVPELALKCCRSQGDPLGGSCEDFVNSHLGDPKKRTQKLNQENYRIKGKPVPKQTGTR